ncbi:glycosyltransferase, family 1 [Campylobacter vicugnae]|uniref:glycosyltransferase family 4 protein n=1 Tax=Campylobacter vicugnae TaxID=1660076 RepID=UPI000A2FE230|nr:glycosyltransferase family 4 protein [Campylobacter sp. RM12175]ARR03274.1 glycosyltransferase, family 1 [Campylobacter sp. RM12175]
MKILLIIDDATIVGGVERVVSNLSNTFLENKHEICVISLYGYDKKDRKLPFLYEEQIKLYFLKHIHSKELRSLQVSNIFLKLLREILRPAVQTINFFIKRSKLSEFKNIISNFKPDFILDNSYSSIFDNYLSNQKAIKVIHIGFDIYKNVELKHENIILLSSKELDSYKTKYPNSNFYIIPNFLPNISNLNTNYSQKCVVSIGRMDRSNQKGFLRLIDIWKLIQDSSEFKDWKLHIVGDGELKEKIENKIKDLNLTNSIILKPFTKDVESEYLSASIYAMTSHFEGLPMVLIEAQSYALPTIAFDIATGPSDIIEDDKSGYLIEDNNLNEYATKLKTLMSDENLRAKMGAKSKEIVKSKFSKDVVMKQWMELFERLKNAK